jgi:dephospho-CoA kinase
LSYRPDTPAYEAIIERFGRNVLDVSGLIDRARLGDIVFSNPAVREELEAIVWPAARGWIENRLIQEKERGTQVVVIEVPKLFESGWDQFMDAVWVVDASAEAIVRRVQERSGLSGSETSERMAAQASSEELIARADRVIENNDSLEELRERVIQAWESIPAIESANPK